jgi:hypothetical protein
VFETVEAIDWFVADVEEMLMSFACCIIEEEDCLKVMLDRAEASSLNS